MEAYYQKPVEVKVFNNVPISRLSLGSSKGLFRIGSSTATDMLF
jgi:hypothetical protein